MRVDEVTREIVRDSDGRVIVCKPGELGELIGMIKSKVDIIISIVHIHWFGCFS